MESSPLILGIDIEPMTMIKAERRHNAHTQVTTSYLPPRRSQLLSGSINQAFSIDTIVAIDWDPSASSVNRVWPQHLHSGAKAPYLAISMPDVQLCPELRLRRTSPGPSVLPTSLRASKNVRAGFCALREKSRIDAHISGTNVLDLDIGPSSASIKIP
ncbi:hypothetical protein BS47DRAFT_1487301 [Hydnum rufescens UP504]|uniref:Uncharacterized protein n=1 Tax=Hydnum rufescens UP504 TaxID=1448309 RepID=A0A9P6ARR2_9AGAM|nr:hypothetical protein BS47DRAFT_1487301 [Hydnum rufescens UP504]